MRIVKAYAFLLYLAYPLLLSNCYHMNIGSTGLLFSYTLGALAYIKNVIKPTEYTLTGISGGSWCSFLYHFEPNIDDHDLLWSVLVGHKNRSIHLLKRSSMQQFQEQVAVKFKDRYKDCDITNLPLSIVVTKNQNGISLQNIKIDKFQNIDDLINYCTCSSYIPLISGPTIFKSYKNEKYIDGEICKSKCISNCINSKSWGRKYSLKTKTVLNYNTSLMLFNDGYTDASKYAQTYLSKKSGNHVSSNRRE